MTAPIVGSTASRAILRRSRRRGGDGPQHLRSQRHGLREVAGGRVSPLLGYGPASSRNHEACARHLACYWGWPMTILRAGFFVFLLGCTAGVESGEAVAPLGTAAYALIDQHVAGFPHAIDLYVPLDATSAVVFLHGGGGTKEEMANQVGIKTDPTTADYGFDPSWLVGNHMAAVFPQGQELPGTNVPTWSNYVMTSGQDDEAFLIALATTLRQFPRMQRVYLVGHSNGGMMANRMWCEAASSYDAYGGVSGSPSVHLDPVTGSFPCNPSVARPYIGIVGSEDQILQIGGNWTTSPWTLAPITVLLTPRSEWYDRSPPHQVINEAGFQLYRTWRLCSSLQGSGGITSADGTTTTWTTCGGALELLRVNGANHCISPLDQTETPGCGVNDPNVPGSLEAVSGLDIKSVLVDFFARQ